MLKSLFKNALSVLTEKGVGIVLTLITTPILLKELGVEKYGIWILLINMVAWAKISNLGFGSTVTRTASIFIEKNTFSAMNKLYNTSLVLHVILGVIGVFVVISPIYLPQILMLPNSYFDESSFILSVLAVKVIADFFLISVNSFYSASLKDNVQSNISSIAELFRGVSSIYLVLNGFGLMGLLFSLILTDIISFFLKLFFIKKIFPEISISYKFADCKMAKEIFSFSKYIMLSNIALIIRQRIGVNIISKYVNMQSVAFFNIAQQLVFHCESVISIINQVANPAASRVLNRDDISMENIYLCMIARLNFFSCAVVVSPLVLFSEFFISIWLGSDFIIVSALINILSLSLLGKFICYSTQSYMIAKAKHKLLPIINIAGTFLTIFMSVHFAKENGLIGVAFGLAVSILLTDVIFFGPILFKALGSEFYSFMKRVVISSVLLIGIHFSFKKIIINFDLLDWHLFISVLFVFVIINTFTLWLCVFFKSEKITHIAVFKKMLFK